ncbi:MAG: phenylalanyl-tRNA synthetase alpha chain [Actinomycetota bacterium]|jgi:phenylalanyl-tRNA synthetase alpha chain
MPIHLTPEQLTRDLALRDLTDATAGPHAIQQLVDLAVGALADAWGCEVRHAPGPRVVPIADNYDNLAFTRDAASRDARYTRYVDDDHMLRSHSSAMIPPALRALAGDPVDDVVLVCPGVVYRRDAIDRLHTGTPHQLDVWRISRKPLGNHDMDEMTRVLIDALAPGRRYRAEPRVHPYTLDGRQVDVENNGEWVEVWECGLAHPGVLARAGLDGWHGLALGLGLDRFLMLRKGIGDIRLLRSADARVTSQMQDLSPYRPVSAMPAVRRDVSVAVDVGDAVEELGDRVRDALGDDADAVEEVSVVAQTDYADLPAAAVERMGMTPGQKNVLVRIVLRHLDRTLTDAEANALRDRIYAALHRGAVHEWAV